MSLFKLGRNTGKIFLGQNTFGFTSQDILKMSDNDLNMVYMKLKYSYCNQN